MVILRERKEWVWGNANRMKELKNKNRKGSCTDQQCKNAEPWSIIN
jgi:hypothetical protein